MKIEPTDECGNQCFVSTPREKPTYKESGYSLVLGCTEDSWGGGRVESG